MNKQKKPMSKRTKWIIGILFLLMLGGTINNILARATENKVETLADFVEVEAVENQEEKSLTFEQEIEKVIEDVVGKTSNIDEKERIESINVNDLIEDEIIVNLVLNGSENLTSNMVRNKMLKDTGELFQKVFNLNATEISITWNLQLVDAKGNVSYNPVLKIMLKENHDINFENFDYKNFEIVADSYWIHESIE